jgi:hypothetical protein
VVKINTRRIFKHKRLVFLVAALFVPVAALMVVFSNRNALAAVTVDTSTTSTITYGSYQRKVWYDGTRHWAAFQAGSSTIEFWYSTNGTSWTQNTSATLSEAPSDFSIEADTSIAYIVYTSNGLDVNVRKASSYPATNFSWGSENVVTSTGVDTVTSSSITRGTNGKLCVAYIVQGEFSPFGVTVNAKISQNADDPSSWESEQQVDDETSSTDKSAVSVSSLADNGFYAVWDRGGSIYGNKFIGPAWDSPVLIDSSSATGSAPGMVSSTSADRSFLAYINTSGNVLFRDYNDSNSTWSSSVTLDSDTDNDNVVITIDKTNGDELYVGWRDTNADIYYKKGVSPYTSGSWDTSATTLYTGTTANYLSSSFRDGGNKISFIWTEGSSSPYDLRYQSIDTQSPPAAPALSTPASGATGVSLTPGFVFNSTDTQADYIRYRLYLYESNCSTAVGSSPFTQPDGTPQTGWSGQDTQSSTAYASGSTATYTYQGTLSAGTTYCWKVEARDPGGSNTYGTASSTRLFTTNAAPATPTLIQPASSQSAIPLRPQFQLRTTDADSDYLRYHIKVYTSQTECNNDSGTNLVRSIDQTSSQTGWAGQDQQSATAYTGAASISSSRIAAHDYQSPPLSPNTAYWWKARAIDPGGANIWSSWATCITFTTASTDVRIQGGVNIRGGSRIQ